MKLIKGKISSETVIKDVFKKKLIKHPDERGFFEEIIRENDNFFKEGFGQLSHSFMYEGVLKAWHFHYTQIDWWFIAKGTLKVALYDMRSESSTYGLINEFILGEKGENCVLKIPAMVAHGCIVLSKSSELFYVTSSIYNPKEEGRIDSNDQIIGYNWIKS